jgi:hypothetical protein
MNTHIVITAPEGDIRGVYGPFESEDAINLAIDNVQAGKVRELSPKCEFLMLKVDNPEPLLDPAWND